MGVIVQFDFAALTTLFPELDPVGSALCEVYWDIATTMHRNDGGGPISSSTLQARLLNMLTGHIAFLYAPRDATGNMASSGSAAPNVTGRVSSASEGSVSVQTEALQGFATAQASWLAQSKYGQLYWASTAQFRTMRYRPAIWPNRVGPGGMLPITFGS